MVERPLVLSLLRVVTTLVNVVLLFLRGCACSCGLLFSQSETRFERGDHVNVSLDGCVLQLSMCDFATPAEKKEEENQQ